jgi:hypothetical protein
MIGRRRIRTLSTLALVASIAGLQALPAASASNAYDPGNPAQVAEYQHALSLGVRAYVYGYPLLDTNRVYLTATSVNVPNGSGGGPGQRVQRLPQAREPSLDIYIQPNPPADPRQRRNWLPSPAGAAFRLIMRLYAPKDVGGILSGATWQPPTVLPCLTDGKTSAGISCASG